MSTRPVSMANQIANAVVTALGQIIETKQGGKWLTSLRTCKRSLMLGDIMTAARPAMCVQVMEWVDKPTGPEHHEATMRLAVHCLVDDIETGEESLNDMASDAIRAITDDESLAGLVTMILPSKYVPQLDAMAMHGIGIASVEFEVVFQWTHGAP